MGAWRMEKDVFTREVCEVSIVGGIATVSVPTRRKRINIDMPVETLIANMGACETAIDEWAKENGAQVAMLTKRGPLFLRERHD